VPTYRRDGQEDAPIHSSLGILIESLLLTLSTLYLSIHFQRATLWFFVPLLFLLVRKERIEEYGLSLHFIPPSYTCHLVLGIAAFFIYTLSHFLAVYFLFDRQLTFQMPENLLSLLFFQFFAIAIPEEFFFRGYLQTRLNQVFGTPYRVLGALVGSGLLLQAVVFAVCHLTVGDWTQLRVFFFALLAGWLRERNGSILAPAVYHTLGNVWVAALYP